MVYSQVAFVALFLAESLKLGINGHVQHLVSDPLVASTEFKLRLVNNKTFFNYFLKA